jgi:hypothetical protein
LELKIKYRNILQEDVKTRKKYVHSNYSLEYCFAAGSPPPPSQIASDILKYFISGVEAEALGLAGRNSLPPGLASAMRHTSMVLYCYEGFEKNLT